MRTGKSQLAGYIYAVLAAVFALLLRKLLDPLLGSANPYHTAWAAVAFAAWYCGLWPAITTLVITLFGIWYWFLAPYHSFAISSSTETAGMIAYVLLCAVLIALGESTQRIMAKRQRAEQELRKAHDELDTRVKERTATLAERTAELERKTSELEDQADMLDLANDAIFVRTAADTISYWNRGAERLYGWTKLEVLGQNTHEILHTEFPIPLDEIKKKETWEGEIRHTKRDGTQITVASRWRTLRDSAGNATGWLEINTDITARKRAEEAARRLSGRILTLQDEERRRVARGLHDSLGQYLAALKMNLDRLRDSDPDRNQLVSDCSQIVDTCLNETRTISHLLHPPLLDESGLSSAVRLYVEEFSRRSGMTVRFEAQPERVRLESDIELALFRAIQEGLTNVHRHAGASSVDIGLTADRGRVRLEIRDNGKGIPPPIMRRLSEGDDRMGVGLAGMRERLRELGGSLNIKSDSTGTKLVVITPLGAKTTKPAVVA